MSSAGNVGVGVMLGALALTACAQQSEQGATARVEEKIVRLTPGTANVKIGFLTGELRDLRVMQRTEAGTGRVVAAPKFRALLRLKNASEDQAARLVSGRIEYTDAGGKTIRLAEGREDTTFRFYSSGPERLDPGLEVSQEIDVPFPAAALGETPVRDIRLEVVYLPLPYREGHATIAVAQ